jgi:AraC-like DNA-binding protein
LETSFGLINISIGELIRNIRLQKAAELLLEHKHSVMDIALMVGFNDRPQFTRSFTNFTGLSPKQYQINHMK